MKRHLPSMGEALGSIPRTERKEEFKNLLWGRAEREQVSTPQASYSFELCKWVIYILLIVYLNRWFFNLELPWPPLGVERSLHTGGLRPLEKHRLSVLQSIIVAKFQLWSRNKDDFSGGGHCTVRNCVRGLGAWGRQRTTEVNRSRVMSSRCKVAPLKVCRCLLIDRAGCLTAALPASGGPILPGRSSSHCSLRRHGSGAYGVRCSSLFKTCGIWRESLSITRQLENFLANKTGSHESYLGQHNLLIEVQGFLAP